MKYIFILLITLSLTLSASDKKKSADEIDYIALAALLLKDGNYQRADEALTQVNLEDKELDFSRFYTLKGLVLTKKSLYKEANLNFDKALKAGQEDLTIYLYIAQNSYKLKEYQHCIDALDTAKSISDTKPKLLALKAECFWQLAKHNESLQLLRYALTKFPTHYAFYKQRFYYLVSLNLYQSALDDATVYLQKAELNEKTTIAFIVALRKAKEIDRAISIAEIANMQYEKSAPITVLLAHLYLDKEQVQSAARLFDEASIEDRKYTKESAELFRRAKEYTLSLYKNSQMLDAKEKYKQKVAIYLEFGDYERVIATHDALERSGLLENEDMRYALAYAYYMVGDYPTCEAELKHLQRGDLFQKALELRKNMQKCQNNHWECE